jgi:hypothetical protein
MDKLDIEAIQELDLQNISESGISDNNYKSDGYGYVLAEFIDDIELPF